MPRVTVSLRVRILVLAAVLAGMVCVQQPVCFSCCPGDENGPGPVAASANCCGEECGGGTFEKGRVGSCLLFGRSAPGRDVSLAGPVQFFEVSSWVEVGSQGSTIAVSPPASRNPFPIALRL